MKKIIIYFKNGSERRHLIYDYSLVISQNAISFEEQDFAQTRILTMYSKNNIAGISIELRKNKKPLDLTDQY